MKFNADYHTHTTFSDGKNSVEENVLQAIKMGLDTIGISDHGPHHNKSGIKKDALKLLRAEVDRLKVKYPQINILLGVEANLVNMKGDIDITGEDLKLVDYVILGIHKFTFKHGGLRSFLFNMRNFMCDTKRHKDKITQAYIKAMEKYKIFCIAHPNYATKCDVLKLAQACKERNVCIELNGKRILFDEPEIKALADSKVKLIVGSDAHSSSRVGDFTKQIDFLNEHKILNNEILNKIV